MPEFLNTDAEWNITANGTYSIKAIKAGRHILLVGRTGGTSFDSASIAVKQDGVPLGTLAPDGTFTPLAITVAGSFELTLDSRQLDLVVTGVASAADLNVGLTRIE
jgi:hypothetical protein